MEERDGRKENKILCSQEERLVVIRFQHGACDSSSTLGVIVQAQGHCARCAIFSQVEYDSG